MKAFKTSKVSILLALLMVVVAQKSSAAAFQNGSFENPVIAAGGQFLPSGSTNVAGWITGGPGMVSFVRGAASGVVDPTDGLQHIDFNGGDTTPGATLSQVFNTVSGQTYSVSFQVGRVGSSSGTMSLLAQLTSSSGGVLGTLTTVAPSTSGYGPGQTLTFTASTTNSTLTFTDTSTATVAVDLLLDNVSVIPQCVPPPGGLVSWWRGEGNANDVVDGNHGTLQNGAAFVAGKVGQAFSFDGVDDYVSFGNTVGNFDTNDFTIDFWIRTTATRHESVIEKWPICNVASMWEIRIGANGPGRLELEMFSDSLGNDHNSLVSGRAINDGAFHHVAFVRKGTNIAFYVDGVLDTSNASTNVTRLNNTANLTAGRSVCMGIDTSPFTGQLDEISVYNRALSNSEIQAIYNAGTAGKCADIAPRARALAHWKFDETGGTVARDSVGPYDGTLSASGASFASGGVSGNALRLDRSTNGFVSMGNVLPLGTNDFSVVAWVKLPAGDTTDGTIVLAKHVAGSANGYIMGANTSITYGRVGKAYFYDSVFPGQEVISTSDINDGNWHQLVTVYEAGGSKAIYVDGAPVEASNASHAIVANSAPFLIGAVLRDGAPAGGFTGSIDEVQIFDYALTSDEVDFLFRNPGWEAVVTCASAPSGLVGWWPGETNANDIIGGRNGTLQGQTSYVPGKVGQAFSFDGDHDAVSIGNPANLQLQNFTIEAWIKRASSNQISAGSIFGEILGYGAGGYVFGLHNDGRLFLSRNGVSIVNSTRTVVDTDWHHIAVSRSGTTVVFYVDSAGDPPLTYGDVFTFSSNLAIGAVNDDFGASFLGLIDELAVFNRARAASEVQSIYNAGSAGKCMPVLIDINPNGGFFTNSVTVSISAGTTNLVVHYTLDGTVPSTNSLMYTSPFTLTNTTMVNAQAFANGTPVSGVVTATFRLWSLSSGCVAPPGAIGWWTGDGNATDVLGLNNGTLAGNATYGPGLIAQAFSFQAEGDGVTINNSASLQLQTFTIEAWVRRQSTNVATLGVYGNGTFFAYGSGGYGFGPLDDGRLLLTRVGVNYVTSTARVTDTNWHHVSVTKAGTNVAFYIDGVLGGTTNYNTTFTFGSNAAIGTTGGSLVASFYGLIDELAIYSRALTTNEIQALYSAGAAGKCPAFEPVIIAQPQNRAVLVGASASFSVTAGGSPPLSYQWLFNGTVITNATNGTFTITSAQSTNGGNYTVTVSNDFGSTNSAPATLTINTPPNITTQPTSQTALIGATVTFTVSATGTPTPTYQWRRNGISIPGATGPILVINNVQSTNAGTYTVRVSNSVGAVTSDPATLTVASGQISSLALTPNGVEITVQGEAGANYTIETSSDLIDWQPLVTLFNNPQNWQFTDPTATGVSQRFYRLRKAP